MENPRQFPKIRVKGKMPMIKVFNEFGREIKVEKKPEMREIAVAAVRDRWSSYPSKGLTPQRLAAIFLEADGGDIYRQAELFEEMEEKDAHLFSQFQTRKNAVLSFDYDVQPYSNSAEDKKIGDFVSENIFGLNSFEDVELDLLDAIAKGYSLAEIRWNTDGRYAVIENMEWIHPKRVCFYEFSKGQWEPMMKVPRILTEAQPIYGEEMPPFKLIYHRYKARSGYDTHAGIMRVCAWMYLFKNYAIKDWVAFSEVYGMPIRIGKFDPGASQGDRDALRAAVQAIGVDAAGVISKNTEIEFVETTKSSGSEIIYEALADFCDRQVSKAVVGQTATSEGTPGKLGSEKIRDKVRTDLIRGDSEAHV
jgi:phage gp29-like protein